MASDWGCLKCQVTWYGKKECWVCGSDTFIVGAHVVYSTNWRDGENGFASARQVAVANEYFPHTP